MTASENIIWNKSGDIEIYLSEDQKYDRMISGNFHLSSKGYLYSYTSKNELQLRLKFLALSIYLPISSYMAKCKYVVKKLFRSRVSEKGLHDLVHIRRLTTIAWKGASGSKERTLLERVEDFALAEINYNLGCEEELSIKRSERFKKGLYVAKCMQPLFHKDQFTDPVSLRQRLEGLYAKEKQLERVQSQKEVKVSGWQSAVMLNFNPYANLSLEEINAQLMENDLLIRHYEKLLKSAEQCQKYVNYAIFNQQCCLDDPIEKEEEVHLFRVQDFCGIVQRVECCALECWSLNLFCCKIMICPGFCCCVL